MIANGNCLQSITVDEDNPKYSARKDILYTKDKSKLLRFHNKRDISHFSILPEVNEIGQRAFEGCRKLERVNIPDKVEVIRYHVFSGCCNLREITIPRSVKRIESFVFDSCRSLTSIDVDENNLHYKSADGVIFSKNNETLVRYPPGKADSTFDIPAGVTTIKESAFKNCMNLTRITVPNSVKTIQSLAFSYCSNLQEINIPANTTSIYPYAFDYCPILRNLEGDAGNESLPDQKIL